MTSNLKLVLAAATVTLMGFQALAQSGGASVSQTAQPEPRKALSEEKWGLKPQFGAMSYTDTQEGSINRFAYGATVEYNFNSGSASARDWYLGAVSGLIYSRLGRTGSDFSGAGGNTGDREAYALLIPANLKVGYNFNDRFRLSAHGGLNYFYRSVSNRMNFGTTQNSNSHTDFLPNVGADAEFALGDSLGVIIRPDYTFTSGDSVFTGTLGLLLAFK